MDSSQVYSLAGHHQFCWIVESCCFRNFWLPEILRVFLAAGALYRVIVEKSRTGEGMRPRTKRPADCELVRRFSSFAYRQQERWGLFSCFGAPRISSPISKFHKEAGDGRLRGR